LVNMWRAGVEKRVSWKQLSRTISFHWEQQTLECYRFVLLASDV